MTFGILGMPGTMLPLYQAAQVKNRTREETLKRIKAAAAAKPAQSTIIPARTVTHTPHAQPTKKEGK